MFLNKSVRRVVVQPGKKEILTAGVVSVAGNGDDRFHVYDETGTGDELAYAKLNEEIELLPGQYTLSLNNSRQLVTVDAGEKTVPVPGLLTVSGTGDDYFYVYYDDQSGSDLAHVKTNEEIKLFSGDYIVSLNDTQQTVSIQDGETLMLAAGRVRVTCPASASSIFSPLYYVYDPEKGPLGYDSLSDEVELFPGNYAVSLNETTQTASVQAGEETLLVSGTLTVSSICTSGHAIFYVYDDTGNKLDSASTNGEVELFPGTYTVSLNDTLATATVQAGEKTVVEAGTVWVSSISTTGNTAFHVYDDTRNELGRANTNQEVELFPGTYTVSLNSTELSATVRSGERTVLEAGTVWVSSILTSGNAQFYVYDAAWDELDKVYTNKEAEFFPGTYTVSLNETRTTTTVVAGERSELKSGLLTVSGTDGSYSDVYDAEGNQLTRLRGDKSLELFPGDYSVVLNDTTLSATVKGGENVSIDF